MAKKLKDRALDVARQIEASSDVYSIESAMAGLDHPDLSRFLRSGVFRKAVRRGRQAIVDSLVGHVSLAFSSDGIIPSRIELATFAADQLEALDWLEFDQNSKKVVENFDRLLIMNSSSLDQVFDSFRRLKKADLYHDGEGLRKALVNKIKNFLETYREDTEPETDEKVNDQNIEFLWALIQLLEHVLGVEIRSNNFSQAFRAKYSDLDVEKILITQAYEHIIKANNHFSVQARNKLQRLGLSKGTPSPQTTPHSGRYRRGL